MPVSPEGGREYAKAVSELYADAAAHLIATVARRLAAGITQRGWAEQKLSEVLRLRRDSQQLIVRLSSAVDDVGLQAMVDAYEAGVLAAGGPGVVSAAPGLVSTNRGAVQAYAAALTESTRATHTRILRSAEDVYRRVIADVAGQAVTGAQTRREVAARAVSRFASAGVTGFVDRADRRWELASYVEMATRTATGQAHVQGGLDRYTQQGRYLVIVSNAPEECELCRPFEGRVLSLSGRAPTAVEVTGHRYAGTLREARARGFLHPNCRHALSAFTPGLTRPPTRDTADPDGDKVRQQQRALERRVRSWKRRVQAVEPFGDTPELTRNQRMLRLAQVDLRSFNTENDRKAYVSQRRVSLTSR